jgi:microcystin-dependent protein
MEKYLIFLTIITFIVIYYCFCSQMKETEPFTTPAATGIDDKQAISTLAALAKDLNSSTGVTMPGNLNVSSNLNVSRNLRVDGSLNVVGSLNFLPTGIIVAWRGSTAPSGWEICNGDNGTPDLRGRFILGQGSGVGLTPRVYDTSGGVETVTLTTTQIPSHTHNYSTRDFEQRNVQDASRVDGLQKGFWTTKTSEPTGGGQSHENMPPFYVLAYIMKL